jgi:PAS domain S-box-containing protein
MITWTAILALSLTWNILSSGQQEKALAIEKAQTHFEKDLALRHWATRHGGVYVPANERTPPNPYLSHVEERDITTPSGIHLTLMNPAYMLRQMNEEYPKGDVSGHITSLKLLRPENAPDDWERDALKAFEQGKQEVTEFIEYRGNTHLRFMRPLITEKGCLKCHAHQGYKAGEIRGGVSVSVAMAPYYAIGSRQRISLYATHGLLWIGGILAAFFIARRSRQNLLQRQHTLESLRDGEERLNLALQGANLGTWDWNIQTGEVVFNKRWAEMLGYLPGEIDPHVSGWEKLQHPDDVDSVTAVLNEHLQGRSAVYQTEHRLRAKSGAWKWVLDTGKVFVRDDQGIPVRMAGTHQDITERKEAEQALKETHKTLQDEHNIFTAGPVVVFKWQNAPGWPVEYVSGNVEEVFGYTAEEFIRGAVSYAGIVPAEDIGRVAEEVKSNSESGAPGFHHLPYRIIRKDGRAVWLLDYTSILRNEAGEVTHYLGYVVDITERKQAEDKIRAALQEKEVLLKEIHHRVKNNLQIISSLLFLQSNTIKNAQVSDSLKDSRNRIHSMALVHEKLYQSKDLARINFEDYIRNLTHYLFRAYGVDSNAVHLRIEADKMHLDVEKAIPCGLIINELVSNSLKYAFTAERQEERNIFIELKKTAQTKKSKQAAEACGDKEKYTLIVGDNGAGLPDGVDFRNSESLGLQLVNTLAGQLDGEIELDKREGTSFIINFNA